MAEPELKAAGFNSSMQAAREVVGAAAFDRFVTGLPPRLRDYLERPRLATAWIAYADAMEINDLIMSQLLAGDLERVFEVGRRQLKQDLTGVYKVFVRLGSVSFITKRTAVIYGTYTRNAGQMRVVRDEPKLVEVETIDHPFGRPGTWQYLRGNLHGGAEASGARGVKSTIVEGGGNERRALMRLTWI